MREIFICTCLNKNFHHIYSQLHETKRLKSLYFQWDFIVKTQDKRQTNWNAGISCLSPAWRRLGLPCLFCPSTTPEHNCQNIQLIIRTECARGHEADALFPFAENAAEYFFNGTKTFFWFKLNCSKLSCAAVWI